jgi:hypothetical protein
VQNAAKQGFSLDYSPQSVEVLDDMITAFWGTDGPSDHAFDDMVKVIGSYLGEVMIRNLGGVWAHNDEFNTAGVQHGTGWWFPHAKVAKRLTGEPGNDLRFFYSVTAELQADGASDQ